MVEDAGLDFKLIESLLLRDGEGYFLLEEHLRRLSDSSRHFGYVCPVDEIRGALEQEAANHRGCGILKVRLCLGRDGTHTIESSPVPATILAKPFVIISSERTDAENPFLYHKTTRRGFYEREYTRLYTLTGCFEVLFLNRQGQVTEGSRTNVFIEKKGQWITPPVAAGLLDGTMRRHILSNPDYPASERVLMLNDLASADRIFVTNSVRGIVDVDLRQERA